MTIKVGINGFGRIGRMLFRAGMHDPELEFVAINDLGDTKLLAHLLKYDSVARKLDKDVGSDEGKLIVDGKEIIAYKEKDPANIPWSKHNVDIVLECTGFFRTEELAMKHINGGGAKKVLISAPAKGGDIQTIVKGINEHEIDKNRKIFSNASCTTNCFAPMAKVLHDNFEIKKGFMVTIHAYTGDQKILDAYHKDPRRARAAAVNLIPTTSGAALSVEKVIPDLKGKIHASAIRAPVPDGSVTYFTCELGKQVSVEEVNTLFKNVASHHMKGVLEYSEEPLVSSDILGNSHSCIFDSKLTEIEGDLLKVVGWYDNEWGYSNRMIDMVKELF